MHVLVTGGAGFIGSHSVEALLAAGARVTVFDNFSSGKRSNLPHPSHHSDLVVIEGDIRDSAALEGALLGVTHVLHLAAQVSVRASVEDPIGSASHNVVGFLNVAGAVRRSHNVVGFLNVAGAVRRASGMRLVYASSAAVYGAPRSLPLDEASLCEPTSPYGLEKLIDDQYASLFRALYGISALGLRYFNVYGPRQDPASPYAGVISRFADRIVRDEPLIVFGDGQQTRDFVFVKDVARANVAALRSGYSGVLNLGTGRTVTLLDLIDALAACAGRSPEVRFDPPAPGDIRDSAMRPERLREVLGEVPATALIDGLRTLI